MSIKTKDLTALPGKVIVKNLQFGERRTLGGIILTDDDGKENGIRPRWAEVFKIGDGVTDIKVGDWVLIEHGRWTRSIKLELDGEEVKVNQIDFPDAVMLISDEPMFDSK